MHKIDETQPGMISVLGGKITGYRAIAEEAVDAVCRKLGRRAPCSTHVAALPGALRPEPATLGQAVRQAVAEEYCRHLADFLLRRQPLAFDPDQGRALAPEAAAEMAGMLGWDEAAIAAEIARYEAEADRALLYREELAGAR